MASRSTDPKHEPTLVADEQSKNSAWLEEEAPRETRGEKKRKATQLERLGESLVDLPPSKFARVPMPDDLRVAVTEARRIKSSRGGYRRQVQFIGKIMRNLDAQPIADALEAMDGEDAPSAKTFRAAEVWRERLIAEGDKALEELVKESPAADRTSLRQLLRAAQKEKTSAKPPHATRALFRELKALFDA